MRFQFDIKKILHCHLQSQDERSHSTSYLVVSSAEKVDAGVGKRTYGAAKTISSNVVAVLSNYHFNRDKQTAKFKPCRPSDCSVGLKYSSSEFAIPSSVNSDAGFHFDRFGLLVPYEAFVSLFTNKDFGTYLNRCKERREQNAPVVGDKDENEDNEEEEDEEDEEDMGGSKKRGIGKKKRSGENVGGSPSKKKATH